MTARDLTEMEERIVSFVGAFRDDHGYCASLKEIGAHCGLSNSTVHKHLKRLRAGGVLLYEDDQNRTVRPA